MRFSSCKNGQSHFLLCRAGTLERNEVGLAELVDVDNAVFGTQELFVVELPGRLKNVRPRRQFLRGAVVAFDCVDPGPLHQYRVVVRRVSVHARLEPAPRLLQQHAERTFFVVAPQDRKLNGCAGMHILPLEVGERHGDLSLAFCDADARQPYGSGLRCGARNLIFFGDHLSHLLINWIREARALYVKGKIRRRSTTDNNWITDYTGTVWRTNP